MRALLLLSVLSHHLCHNVKYIGHENRIKKRIPPNDGSKFPKISHRVPRWTTAELHDIRYTQPHAAPRELVLIRKLHQQPATFAQLSTIQSQLRSKSTPLHFALF